jgi:hypothetical protein
LITEANRDNLYRITSNLSYKDYQNALKSYKQYHKRIKYGDFSYSLSAETVEALEHYKTACQQEITADQEEAVKVYLLKIRFAYPDLWEQTNPNYEQWNRNRC